MAGSKKGNMKRKSLPKNFGTLKEFWSFWDTQSSADYEDVMEDVKMEAKPGSSKLYCPVAKDIITKLREEARHRGISMETLINLWLREKTTGRG